MAVQSLNSGETPGPERVALTAEEALKKRQRAARGSAPRFFQDPVTDRLVTVMVALMGEVAALRDRIDTHEQLARQGTVATPEALEQFAADATVQRARDAWRHDYIRRIMRAFTEEAELVGGQAQDKARIYALDEFMHPDTYEESDEARLAER